MSSETENEVDMSKLTVGKRRDTVVNATDHSREGNSLFILGIAVICVMLSLPMVHGKSTENMSYDDAVPVMSSGVAEREELNKPDRDTSANERWSIYDYIGEMFADLIFGDR